MKNKFNLDNAGNICTKLIFLRYTERFSARPQERNDLESWNTREIPQILSAVQHTLSIVA